jgi:hypothetical protein
MIFRDGDPQELLEMGIDPIPTPTGIQQICIHPASGWVSFDFDE